MSSGLGAALMMRGDPVHSLSGGGKPLSEGASGGGV